MVHSVNQHSSVDRARGDTGGKRFVHGISCYDSDGGRDSEESEDIKWYRVS